MEREGKDGETMATTQRRGLACLVSDHGHTLRYADAGWLIYPDGRATLAVECAFCERPLVHYIARDATGRACWQATPYTFATLAQAEAARDELAGAQVIDEGE